MARSQKGFWGAILRCYAGMRSLLPAYSEQLLVTLILSFSLITIGSVLPDTAHGEHRTPEGTGLFALSLEEALDIRVDVSSDDQIEKSGIYLFNRHELLRFHQRQTAPGHSGSLANLTKPVTVLLDTEYFGDFASFYDVVKFARELRQGLIQLEVYSGDRARWWSDQSARIVVNIITARAPTRFVAADTDAEAQR